MAATKPSKVDERHCLTNARVILSPNCDNRPLNQNISMVVIHSISLPKGEFGTGLPEQLFTNSLNFEEHSELIELQGVRVSAHVLITRDGEVVQFVPFDQRAWHAGESSWQGRNNCNDFSIGIELEGTDDLPYDERQYEAVVPVVVALNRQYKSLSLANLVGHSEIAPTRKTDPGPHFDWQRFIVEVANHISLS